MVGVGRKGARRGSGLGYFAGQDCQTVCGDRLRTGWEECDDGNEARVDSLVWLFIVSVSVVYCSVQSL